MHGRDRRDALVVAVAARVIVGPGDVFRLLIVARAPGLVRVLVLAVEEVCAPDAAERAERRAEVLMVARGEESAAALAKARDALTIRLGQPVTCVHGEEPQLVEVGRVETT
jgi:hypothetical protein